MALAPNIKIALGMLVPASDMKQLNIDVDCLNAIQQKIWEHLFKILQRSPLVGNFPDVGWQYKPSDITDRDLVVYFVRNSMKSVIKRVVGTTNTHVGGLTAIGSPKGTISEVYIENNFPPEKLGNMAFHELMHNKLQMDNSMHNIHGMGVGVSPATECSILTPVDIARMAGRLTTPVKQYADELTGDVPAKFFIRKTDSGVKFFCNP